MKKNILLLGSGFWLLACATAQTNVSGFISANTTWNLAGSPYIVVGNTLLSNGYTLTIEPGVVVKFNDSTALQIDGELIAIGIAANRIIFTSSQAVPAAGDWAKIHFSDMCVDAAYDTLGNYVSGCIMKYCDILYGGGLGFGAIHNIKSSPYISHCNIWYSASAGLFSKSVPMGPACTIDSSSIKNCLWFGIYFDGFESGLLISYNTIENNQGGLVLLSGSSLTYDKRIINNLFISNYSNASLKVVQVPDYITITGNYFINNTTVYPSSIFADEGFNYGSTIFECNHFLNNQSGTSIYECSYFHYGSIRNNIFEWNTSAQSIMNFMSGANLFFQNNLIKNNTSQLGYIMETYLGSSTFYFNNNSFIDNSAIATIYIRPYSGGTSPMKHNNFINPNCQYELYNANQYGVTDVYVDSNYWGSTSTQYVDSAIYDYFDFANQSVVYYMPYLMAPAYIDTTCPVITVGINTPETESEIPTTIFPNPFTTQATITFSKEIYGATFRLYNLFGQLVQEKNNIRGREIILTRENLGSGVYVFEVTEQSGRISRGKIIVD